MKSRVAIVLWNFIGPKSSYLNAIEPCSCSATLEAGVRREPRRAQQETWSHKQAQQSHAWLLFDSSSSLSTECDVQSKTKY